MKITNRCFNPPCSFATNWLHHGARAIRSPRGERRGSFTERGNRHNAAGTQELLAAVRCRLLSLILLSRSKQNTSKQLAQAAVLVFHAICAQLDRAFVASQLSPHTLSVAAALCAEPPSCQRQHSAPLPDTTV